MHSQVASPKSDGLEYLHPKPSAAIKARELGEAEEVPALTWDDQACGGCLVFIWDTALFFFRFQWDSMIRLLVGQVGKSSWRVSSERAGG